MSCCIFNLPHPDEKIQKMQAIVLVEKLSEREVSAYCRGRNSKHGPALQEKGTQSRISKNSFKEEIRECRGRSKRLSGRTSSKCTARTSSGISSPEARPYPCSECTESFHTNILLAVHKRIHFQEPISEEDEDNVDDFSSNIPYPSSTMTSTSGQILTTHVHSLCKDMLGPPSSEDNDVSIVSPRGASKRSLPSPSNIKTNTKCSKSLQNKRSKLSLYYYRCPECPACFSRQWYLNLHVILLHDINEGKDLHCPKCDTSCGREVRLRAHVTKNHPWDVYLMNRQISSTIGVATSALTGERNFTFLTEQNEFERNQTHDGSSEGSETPMELPQMLQKSDLRRVVEDELRRTVVERFGMGDTFTVPDIQRLALEISNSFFIQPFENNTPGRNWARSLLSDLKRNSEVTKPKKSKNSSYAIAVTELLPHGLTEDKIFYACDALFCYVRENKIVTVPKLASEGRAVPKKGEALTIVVGSNASGSVVLSPTIIFRGQIVDCKNLNNVKSPSPSPSFMGNFIGNEYFRDWFSYFIRSIPPVRPVLLLVEGHVSEVPYHVLRMARKNNVNISFLPSRNRYVHPHQLIRRSLLEPLEETFEIKSKQFLEVHGTFKLKDFGQIFDLSWMTFMQEQKISKSFYEAGFMPLPEGYRCDLCRRCFFDERDFQWHACTALISKQRRCEQKNGDKIVFENSLSGIHEGQQRLLILPSRQSHKISEERVQGRSGDVHVEKQVFSAGSSNNWCRPFNRGSFKPSFTTSCESSDTSTAPESPDATSATSTASESADFSTANVSWNDYKDSITTEELKLDCKTSYYSRLIIPAPIPEHDYLGQIFLPPKQNCSVKQEAQEESDQIFLKQEPQGEFEP